MKKIKLDPFTVALIVIALLIVFSLVGRYLNSVKSRVSELERQIHRDLQQLKLTKQRQEELVQKAITVYRIVISAVFLAFIALISLAVLAGMSYTDALEIHLGTAGILVASITTLFYHTWNPDVLLKVIRDKIRGWVYKKNGFDPAEIELIQTKIEICRLELDEIKEHDMTKGLAQNAMV